MCITSRMSAEDRPSLDPMPIDVVVILNLRKDRVVEGISHLIKQRLAPLDQNPNRSVEETWQYDALDAVYGILVPDPTRNGNFNQAVEASLRYMHFLGFDEGDLTADGIVTAVEDRYRPYKIRKDGVVELNPNREAAPLPQTNWVDITSHPRHPDHKLFYPVDKFLFFKRQRMLKGLDMLMLDYDQFPTFEETSLRDRNMAKLAKALFAE
jgi:hypothetical protein